jgi:hypothetical protein
MRGTPENMRANLWTDRKSLHALYTPVVQANGVEIEIPHSMIDDPRTRVSVRTEQDLLGMINEVGNPELRIDLQRLYFHPARENVGLLSDVVRAIVTQSFRREGNFDRRMNLYTDRDSMADVALMRDHQLLEGKGEPPVQGLEAAKLSIQAMKQSLDEPIRGPAVRVPDDIHEHGFAVLGKENDVMAAVPGHPTSRAVVGKMRQTLEEVDYKRVGAREKNAARQYSEGVKVSIAYFRSLATGNENEPMPRRIDPEEALTAFVLAERVRCLGPELQDRVDDLEDEMVGATDDEHRQRCLAEASAIAAVCSMYNDHTEYFVNLCTYLPQSGFSLRRPQEALGDFYRHVFSAVPRVFDSEGSWKGGLVVEAEVDDYRPTFAEHVKANAFVMNLLKEREGGFEST